MNRTLERLREVFTVPFETIRVDSDTEGIATLTLVRPDVRNAFNETTVSELGQALYIFSSRFESAQLRALVLRGEGPVFCAGADLAMMRAQGASSYDLNLEDSRRLAQLFRNLSEVPIPVVCVVQGAAIGGGFGLAVCSDIVLTHEHAVFATTEVKLGLIPAVISPYIVRKIGLAAASFPLLTGSRISGQQAAQLQLAQRVVPEPGDLVQALSQVTLDILGCAPQALRQTKDLLRLAYPLPEESVVEHTVQAIARARGSAEAQYGLRCFFGKVLPRWSLTHFDEHVFDAEIETPGERK